MLIFNTHTDDSITTTFASMSIDKKRDFLRNEPVPHVHSPEPTLLPRNPTTNLENVHTANIFHAFRRKLKIQPNQATLIDNRAIDVGVPIELTDEEGDEHPPGGPGGDNPFFFGNNDGDGDVSDNDDDDNDGQGKKKTNSSRSYKFFRLRSHYRTH